MLICDVEFELENKVEFVNIINSLEENYKLDFSIIDYEFDEKGYADFVIKNKECPYQWVSWKMDDDMCYACEQTCIDYY